MSKWVGPGQVVIERIMLNGCQVLKVTKHGYIQEYCRSVAAVARHVDLADLVELIELPSKP